MKNFGISEWIITFIKQEYKLLFKEIVMKLSKTSIQNIEEIIHFQADILNNIRDCVIVVDLEGKIVFWNKGAENLYGYSADEVLGQFISILYSDNTPNFERDFEDTKQSIKNGIEFTGVFNGKKKDGASVLADFRRTYLRDEKGKVIGFISVSRDATELKKAEEHIKKANLYHRGLIEASLDPLVTIGPDGKITDVNSATETITGYSREYLVGTDFSNYFTEPEKARSGYEKVFKDGLVKDYELGLKHKKGYITPVSYNASVYRDENNEIIGVFAAARDITERKIAEKALQAAHDNLEVKVKKRTAELEEAYQKLRESEGKLKVAMDLVKLVYWEYDVESDMFTFDDHFYKLYGTNAKEDGTQMSSKEYSRRFIPPEESYLVREEIEKALKTDDPDYSGQSEHTIIRADGEKRFILVSFGVIKDDKCRTIKTYGASQDITERKKAEREIKERSRKIYVLNKIITAANRSNNINSLFKDVLELSMELMNFESGGIYLIDEDLKIAKLMFATGIRQDFIKLTNKPKIDEFPYSQVLKDGKSLFLDGCDVEYPEIFKKWNLKSAVSLPIYSDEKIVGSFNLASHERHHFTEEEKRLINAIGREIGNTYSKLVYEENLKNIVKELKRSNEELEQFAYITSHDLQEPLRTIASFTQLLQMRYKDKFDSDADEFMEYMVDASIRMKEMIQGLLNYSRIGKEGMNFETLSLDDLLDEALSNLKFTIDENDAVITHDTLPSVIGDPKLLVQLFQNLISNAIKFRKKDQTPQIHISAFKNEERNRYIISVEDNGIGIDPQYANRIFKVFKRLHTFDEYKGAGIGLAISRRIVEIHGGKIWVESELDRGSKFYFTLKSTK